MPRVVHALWLLSLFAAPLGAYTKLSHDTLLRIPEPGNDFDIHNGALLAPILRPRVPGTPGSLEVQHHFIRFFQEQLPHWKLELHNSTSKTPATGDRDVPFVNLIATRDPPWAKEGDVGRLALVAHYDSKMTPKGFVGAIDSAAPCAMILHAARSIDRALSKKWATGRPDGSGGAKGVDMAREQGVQIILLDGEEAFVSWTDSDSLYGARWVSLRFRCGGFTKDVSQGSG
jgi:glutaminyl-peptide cyclotransferase